MIPIARPKFIIPTAEPEFTNPCACRIPPLPALSPLVKGGEGRGEGGFEADTLTNFGSAIGINALQSRVNSLWTRVNALQTRVNALRTRVHLYQSPSQRSQKNSS